MRTQSPDTHPEAERVQIELLRKAGPARRFKLTRSLNRLGIQLSRQAIRKTRPHATGEELRLFIIELYYGKGLADRLRGYPTPEDEAAFDILLPIIPVVEALEQLGVTAYIGGSVASSAHGIPRSTIDADIIANLRTENVQPLVNMLKNSYYIDADLIRNAILRHSEFSVLHLQTMFKIDVFIQQIRAFDQQVMRRIEQQPLDEHENTRLFYLESPEDVILTKLEWYDMGCGLSDQQWYDILGVLKVQGDTLDLAYLRYWAKELGVTEQLVRALDDAGLTPEA